MTHRGRIAGIDFGTVRVGIATADLEVAIASPYATYTRRNPTVDAQYFRTLAETERLVRFVVGLPVHLDGQESAKSQQARQFGRWLQECTSVPVVFFDERFTSVEAEQYLLEADCTKKQRRARVDQLAAQIMLSAYLDSGSQSQTEIEGLE